MHGFWPTIRSMKTRVDVANTPRDFLHDHFNLQPIHPTSGSAFSRSILVRVLNSLVKQLNDKEFTKLPKYLFVLLDTDLIEAVHFGGFGCKIIFEKTLYWLMNNIQIVLDMQTEDLRTKKTDAVHADEPAVISLPIPIRPFINNTSKGFVFAQCKTYNAILNNQLQKFPFQSMLPLTFPEDRGFFDLSGYLSPSGKFELWRIINRETRCWEHQSSSWNYIYKPIE